MTGPRERSRTAGRQSALAGAALATLFVGQPVLDLVARHPAFLDAHRLGPGGIVALALLTTLTPAAASAALGAWALRRLPRLARLFLVFLAPALLVVPAVFLLHPEVRERLSAPEVPAPVEVSNPVPVIFVVLDELPLAVLLDEDGQLDRTSFPSFARLAATSHWFAEARSPYATTLPSVPAILTGRYADDDLVVGDAESCNLFTDLAGTYRLDVEERVTRLARGIHRPGWVHTLPPSPAAVVARDLGVLYLHRVLPSRWTQRLPPVGQGWGFFRAHAVSDAVSDAVPDEIGLDSRVTQFLDFVERVTPHEVPALSFFHSDLPHRPWTLGGDDLASQTRAVDGLLGRLLDRLVENGLLDDSLLVVVADHGIGLEPGAGERGDPDRRVVYDEILRVPLFVKLPAQTEGLRHDAYVETVDVVPTLAETLSFEPVCPPDGRSLFAGPRTWRETTFFRHRGWILFDRDRE